MCYILKLHAGVALLKLHTLIPYYMHQLCKKLQEGESLLLRQICCCYSWVLWC